MVSEQHLEVTHEFLLSLGVDCPKIGTFHNDRLLFLGDRLLNYHISCKLCERYPVKTVQRIMGKAISNRHYDYVIEQYFPNRIKHNPGEVLELAVGFMREFEPFSHTPIVERVADLVISMLKVDLDPKADDEFSAFLISKKTEVETKMIRENYKGKFLEHLSKYHIADYPTTSFIDDGKGFTFTVNTRLFGSGIATCWNKKDAEQLAFKQILDRMNS